MGDTPLDVLFSDLGKALWETALMSGISLGLSLVAGLPLGFLLFLTRRGMLLENRALNLLGGFAINLVRSLPFVILLILVLPLAKLLTGHTTGPVALIGREVEVAISAAHPNSLSVDLLSPEQVPQEQASEQASEQEHACA